MDSKERETLLNLQKNIDKLMSEQKASGSSTSAHLQAISTEIKQLLEPAAKAQAPIKAAKAQAPIKAAAPTFYIRYDLDKVFAAEEVGHLCDMCYCDLAVDPERPRAALSRLEETCVLACGHVYHFKCLRGATLDLVNRSTNPSCIFCLSNSS
ncbi:unnamed protein product [Cochlearia groenlandica]